LSVNDSVGQPLSGIVVDVLRGGDLMWMASATTNTDGTASFRNLPNGTYTVLAGVGSLAYIPRYLGDTTDPAAARQIALNGHDQTLSDTVSLRTGGRAQGTVASAGTPLEGAFVTLYQTDGTAWKSTLTDASGAYDIGGIPAGQLVLSASKLPQYAERYWQNAETFAGATPVTWTATETQTVDLTLLPKGRISGKVLLADGAAPYQIVVVVYDTSYNEITYTYADGEGDYHLYVPAGDYIVSAGEGSNYVVNYSDQLTVSATAAAENVDFFLDHGGIIAGTVLEADGSPVSGAYVDFYVDSDGLVWIDAAITDAYGAYESPLLEANTYYVQFYGSPTYVDVWYPDAISQTNAVPVTVSRFETVENIDFTAQRVP
jgi:hypothetical protein